MTDDGDHGSDEPGTGDGAGGTYTLVFAVPGPVTVTVGALGTQTLPAGGYAYTGSALGPGGFSRVDRHRHVAVGDHDVRHWHVDALGGHDEVRLAHVVRAAGRAAECDVARALPEGPVDGFGASDCDCRAHLAAFDSVGTARRRVERAYATLEGSRSADG